MTKTKVTLSRPKDKSLEAFKAWIAEIYFNLTGKTDSVMTEKDWLDTWRKFWSQED